jgi:hypothetical protein
MKLTVVNVPMFKGFVRLADGRKMVVTFAEGQEIDSADLAPGEGERLLTVKKRVAGGRGVHIFGKSEDVAAWKSGDVGKKAPIPKVAKPVEEAPVEEAPAEAKAEAKAEAPAEAPNPRKSSKTAKRKVAKKKAPKKTEE